MFVNEIAPDVHVHAETEDSLALDRTDINFEDLTEDIVRITVRIHNHGRRRSAPTTVRLESAPLGAFAAWQSLATLPLPPIEPGESRVVSLEALRPDARTLAGSNQLPPAPPAAIAAAPLPDGLQDTGRDIGFERALTDWIVKHRARWRKGLQRPPLQKVSAFPVPGANPPPNEHEREERRRIAAEVRTRMAAMKRARAWRGPVLAGSPMDAQGRRHFYWAGNLNVFVGNRPPVERHMTKALRIYPGILNAAMFIIGHLDRPDAYSFQFKGLSPDWNAALGHFMPPNFPIRPEMRIPENKWVGFPGLTQVTLNVSPPADCKTGSLEVHVTRRSCGATAIVEFTLDPDAQGAGCYHV